MGWLNPVYVTGVSQCGKDIYPSQNTDVDGDEYEYRK